MTESRTAILPESIRSVHFVGIGGSGMSAIAFVLLKHGYAVSGSDLGENAQTRWLANAGARICKGHAAANVGPADLAVVSTAIPKNNPERLEADARGIPVWQRAKALAAIMASTQSIAVAGAHGKTTTTSMVGMLLSGAGLDPTVLVGGELNDFGGNARVGTGIVVAEADESDGSFLLFKPNAAIVTNIDSDHMDYWGDYGKLCDGYRDFALNIARDGLAVICVDSTECRDLAHQAQCEVWTYGTKAPGAYWRAINLTHGPGGVSFDCIRGGDELGRVELSVPGAHNAANALGAIAMATRFGVSFETARDVIKTYRGAARRWQRIGVEQGVSVYDDYAHHPTEVAATLAGARAARNGSGGRIYCVFQPHRFSRTLSVGQMFGPAFNDADCVVVTDVYAAGEAPIAGVSGETVHGSVVRHGSPEAHYIPSKDQAIPFLMDRVQDGDLVITMGAGDIWRVGQPLLEGLRQRPQAVAG